MTKLVMVYAIVNRDCELVGLCGDEQTAKETVENHNYWYEKNIDSMHQDYDEWEYEEFLVADGRVDFSNWVNERDIRCSEAKKVRYR